MTTGRQPWDRKLLRSSLEIVCISWNFPQRSATSFAGIEFVVFGTLATV
jgi:hypothetical protein